MGLVKTVGSLAAVDVAVKIGAAVVAVVVAYRAVKALASDSES